MIASLFCEGIHDRYFLQFCLVSFHYSHGYLWCIIDYCLLLLSLILYLKEVNTLLWKILSHPSSLLTHFYQIVFLSFCKFIKVQVSFLFRAWISLSIAFLQQSALFPLVALMNANGFLSTMIKALKNVWISNFFLHA